MTNIIREYWKPIVLGIATALALNYTMVKHEGTNQEKNIPNKTGSVVEIVSSADMKAEGNLETMIEKEKNEKWNEFCTKYKTVTRENLDELASYLRKNSCLLEYLLKQDPSLESKQELWNDNPVWLLARMIYGEARSCNAEERIAIGYTAINRLKAGYYGDTLHEVVLARWQYSCFNNNDPNLDKLLKPTQQGFGERKAWRLCVKNAYGILAQRLPDYGKGATHYLHKNVEKKTWWTKSPKMQRIGILQTKFGPSRHVFYKEKR